MCGGLRKIRTTDELSTTILNLLNEIVFFSNGYGDSKNVYVCDVKIPSEDTLRLMINITNKRRRILNIVEPNRDLTFMLLKAHFTPFIESEKIVWSYW